MKKLLPKKNKSLKLFTIPLLLFTLLLPACTLPFGKKAPQEGPKVTLTYWGLFEPEEYLKPLIDEYESAHPNVKIEYTQRTFQTLFEHKETLLTRLSQKSGPDVFRIHLTWLPSFFPKLSPAPPKIFSSEEFSSAFFSVTKEWALQENAVYAVPLMYDGLLLFYNREMFNEAAIEKPPTTWEEFRSLAAKLTKRDTAGKITQAGAAIGSAENVAHTSDILGLMWAQSGISFPEGLTSQAAADALTFYTNFLTEDRIWDETLPYSLNAFAEGRVAMIFAPSWQVHALRDLNPGLSFTVSSVPQLPKLPGQSLPDVNWATFWVEVVSKDCQEKDVAWDFLKFLSKKESLQKFYSLATRDRVFGEPYPRVEMASSLSVDEYLGPLMVGAETAKTFLITDRSGNDPFVEAIKVAILEVLKGKKSNKALETAQATINQLLGY